MSFEQLLENVKNNSAISIVTDPTGVSRLLIKGEHNPQKLEYHILKHLSKAVPKNTELSLTFMAKETAIAVVQQANNHPYEHLGA